MPSIEERQRAVDDAALKQEQYNLHHYGFRYVTHLPPPDHNWPIGPALPVDNWARWAGEEQERKQRDEQAEQELHERVRLAVREEMKAKYPQYFK